MFACTEMATVLDQIECLLILVWLPICNQEFILSTVILSSPTYCDSIRHYAKYGVVHSRGNMSILRGLFPLYTSFLFSLAIPAAADNGIVLEAVKGTERSHGKMTHSRSAGISGSSRAEHHSQLSRNVSDSQIVEKSRSPTDKDSVYSSDSIGSLDQAELSDLDQGRTRGSSPSTDLPASDSPVSSA